MKPDTREARTERIAESLAVADVLKQQGWGKVSIAITRGGTLTLHLDGEGDKVARPAFGTGRAK
jgi:hypothetical protein